MILRRPYAFLVRHFRLIHAVLLILMLYVTYKFYNVLSFYNAYIGYELLSNEYEAYAAGFLGFFSVIDILLIIFLNAVIVYLLKYKRKPVLLYGIITGVYILIFILFIFSIIFVGNFRFSPPSPVSIRIVRDVILITFVVQLVLIAIVFVRAIGFDIKKFDFKKDVQELGISSEDNEEFEFEINLDTQDFITRLKKRIRYFKYYYKENIVVFYVIYAIIAIIIVGGFVSFITSLEHVYKEGEKYEVGNIAYRVVKSYRTLNNSKGNRINDKYYYVIIKLEVKNPNNYGIVLNTANMKLYYDDMHSTTPNTNVYKYFKEYGIQYYNQIVNPGEEETYSLIYQIPIEAYSKRLKLRTLYTAYYNKNGGAEYGYRSVRLNPELDKEKLTTVETKKLGEEMNFKDSILGNTTLKINDFKLSDTFYYNITNCNEESCRTAKSNITASAKQNVSLTIMRLNYNIKYDTEVTGTNYNVNDFITRFGRIRYVVNGIKENQAMNHNIVLKDVTPLYTNKISFIEVKNVLNRADIIYLDFTIRDKVYTYILKDTLSGKEKDSSTVE